MKEYQVNTTLSNGATINSGTIIIPDATIPIANSTTLGGVMPVTKTDSMTQEVGVDSTGKLYTAPGGGGSNIQIYHGYKSSVAGATTIDLFPSNYDLSANYTIMFITWNLNYGEEYERYYNTTFTYGYNNGNLEPRWNVYTPESPDKHPSLTWEYSSGANNFNVNIDVGADLSNIEIVAISIPKN